MSLFAFKAVLCQYCLFPLFPVKEVGGEKEKRENQKMQRILAEMNRERQVML